MQVKSLLARALTALVVFWLFIGAAHADTVYYSRQCVTGGACSGYGAGSTDVNGPLTSAYTTFSHSSGLDIVCNQPGAHDYDSQTGVNAGDSNGTSVLFPIVWTNCHYQSGALVPGNDPAGTLGVIHTFENTSFAVTTCKPGYSTGYAYPGDSLRCWLDVASAVATDAANERGAAPSCDKCLAQEAKQWAPGSEWVSPVIGDPINAATGNEMLVEADYVSAGGNLVSFSRTYNSGAGFDVLYQTPGWSHNYSYRAIFPDNGSTVVLQRPDGNSETFTLSQGTYTGPVYDTGTLKGTFASGRVSSLQYVRADGTVEQYTGAGTYFGLLSSITFAQGGALTFTYNTSYLTRVQDDRGHAMQFGYGTVGGYVRLTTVTLPDSTVVTYGYDSAGRLTSAAYPGSVARSYQYPSWTNANGQLNSQRFKLTRVVAENGNPVVNVAYDTLGRATASWVGSHNVSLTQVNYGAGSATVTDQLGVSTAMAFTSFDNSRRFYVSATSHNCDGGCAGGDAFEYDSRGNLSGITTKLGVKTCIAYTTPRNLPVLVVEGLPSGASCSDALASPPSDARVRTYQWHASYAVPMTVTGPQMKTLFSYDTAGRVLLRAEVDTNDFTGAAGANAQSTGNSRTTTWTYDAKGSVASLKSSRSDVSATTTYTYDTAENLTSATDPVGLVTTFGGYDANGRPGLVTYPNGLQTSLAYDARGRVTQVTTGGAATTYSYDAAGLLVSSTLPSGISLSMGYDDANRLILTQDSLGNRVDRVLDAAGNVVQETVKGNGGAVALSSQAAYDQLSRITSLTKAF